MIKLTRLAVAIVTLWLSASPVDSQPVQAFVQGTHATGACSPGADSWSPTYNPGSFTLSNSNLTATTTSFNTVDTLISTICHTSGLLYNEYVAGPSGDDINWGYATSTHAPTLLIGNGDPPTNDPLSFGFRNNRRWRINNGDVPSGMSTQPQNGDVVGIAINLNTGFAWVRDVNQSAAVWWGDNGTGDPVAGTNGLSISLLVGLPLYIAYTNNQNSGPGSVTMNPGTSSFAATAPSGYSAWGP